MSEDAGRYAVYFAPEPGSPLARFGSSWLGYDAATGDYPTQPAIAAFSPECLDRITAEPRLYGFHATLKPPFALAQRTVAGELEAAVAALARRFPVFAAPVLRLACISGFWALMLSEPCPQMDELAAACVADLDGFRAPPSATELARRRSVGLSPVQDALLERWGYPYVMEAFRFHMTLTSRLDPAQGALVVRELAPIVAPFCRAPLEIDAVCLFRQERRGSAFRLVRRYPLAG